MDHVCRSPRLRGPPRAHYEVPSSSYDCSLPAIIEAPSSPIIMGNKEKRPIRFLYFLPFYGSQPGCTPSSALGIILATREKRIFRLTPRRTKRGMLQKDFGLDFRFRGQNSKTPNTPHTQVDRIVNSGGLAGFPFVLVLGRFCFWSWALSFWILDSWTFIFYMYM